MKINLYILAMAMILLSCNNAGDKQNGSDTATGQTNTNPGAGQENGATNANKINAAIKVNDVNIVYNECGKGDTTLFLIHGWGINKEYWKEQEKYFCDKYKVVTIDLPGFGQSGKNRTDWSFEQYTNDIHEFIKSKNLKNVILVGHSMSGDILLLMDTKYPESVIGIVGIDNFKRPGQKNTERDNEEMEEFFGMINKNFIGTVDSYTRESLFSHSTDLSIVDRVMRDIKMSDSVIAIKVLRSFANVVQTEKDMMQQLNHKLYLVNSEMNSTKIDSLKKYCKASAELVTVPSTCHYPMIEKPDEFNAALEKVNWMIGNKLQHQGGQ
jgi:pimeloyl-ACP methyl ester carboxylesterase